MLLFKMLPKIPIKEPTMPEIPLSKILANPKNPRRVITLEMIENMAASLDAVGLKNDIKLNVLPDGSYELISGHIRFAGAQRLGWETISAELLTLTPDEAELVGLIDNQSTQMHWLDWVVAIEKLKNGPGKLKQQQIADKLGVTQARVNYALKAAKALTPASRTLIYNSVIKLGPEKSVSEVAVRALADLGDPKEVERALPVFLDRRMTAPQAKRLVKWLKEGKPLEAYNANGHNQELLAQPNPAPRLAASAQVPPNSTQPEKEQTFGEIWAEMKTGWDNLLPNASGTEKEARENRYIIIFTFAILAGLIWLAWKAVVWVITAVIHWL